MPTATQEDPRLLAVEWRSFCQLSFREVLSELLLSAPWLILSLVFAHLELYVPALASSFLFFLCGLRQVHNAFHYAVGVSRLAHEWMMVVLSILMMTSMHAVQFNHLRHHRHCMQEEDVEAIGAKMPAWKAILIGPLFIHLLHRTALTMGKPSLRCWIYFELSLIAILIVVAFGVLDFTVLRYHVLAMICGECLSAFFAVWTVHHDCHSSQIARTIRGRMKSLLTYNMFYHAEHHLFPAVPTRHLPKIASQLDELGLEFRDRLVL